MTGDSVPGELVHVVVGPPRHGVVQHALRVAAAGAGRIVRLPSAQTAAEVGTAARVIVQFTDRLFGADAVAAAAVFEQLVSGADRVTVVLHDLPQTSDGGSWGRRREGYARVSRRADVVVVSSRHEACLLRDVAPEVTPVVIPLPVDPDDASPVPDGRDRAEAHIGVLGFLYPGKGVEDVIRASAGLGVTVRNLGTVAAGHEDLTGELAQLARECGVSFEITGWLSTAELADACRVVAVPVAAHQHISASGSINTWLAAGRRPVVTRSAYVTELAHRMPGAVRVVDPDHLRMAITRALADPASTWLGPGVRISPRSAEVARQLELAAG